MFVTGRASYQGGRPFHQFSVERSLLIPSGSLWMFFPQGAFYFVANIFEGLSLTSLCSASFILSVKLPFLL